MSISSSMPCVHRIPLAATGYGINYEKVARVVPGEKPCARVDISPVSYSLEVQAMSADFHHFVLLLVFTMDPRVEDAVRYAKISYHVGELVKGALEDETRVLAASMTMAHILHGARSFKQAVFESVQLKMDQFGIIIYESVNAIVKQPGDEYFFYLGQEEINQGKADVAEARMKGAKKLEGMSLHKNKDWEVGETSSEEMGKHADADYSARYAMRKKAHVFAAMGVRAYFPIKLPAYLNVGHKNERHDSDRALVDCSEDDDLELGRGLKAQVVPAGATKEQLARVLLMVSQASIFVGVSAGVHQPGSTGSVFAGHQTAYYSAVAALLAAVPVEMATASWLRRTSNPRFHAFAKVIQRVGAILCISVAAVGGVDFHLKA